MGKYLLVFVLGFGLAFGIFYKSEKPTEISGPTSSSESEVGPLESSTELAVSPLASGLVLKVTRVIDGDTLKVRLDLGFGTFSRHDLRLRGIDCPEMSTKAGEEAKIFVQSYIKEAQRIVVRSSRSDKYDRYLADVFLPAEEGKDVYLNNLLLENGHAQRM